MDANCIPIENTLQIPIVNMKGGIIPRMGKIQELDEKLEFGVRFTVAVNQKYPNTSYRAKAEKLGVSAGFVNQMEKGEKMPSSDLGVKLAKKLGVAFEWLMTGRGPTYVGKTAIPLDHLSERDRQTVLALVKSLEENDS